MTYSSLESELRIRLAAKQMPFHRYKRLCEWLNCFQYINPDDRRIDKSLLKLPSFGLYRALEMFQFALWLDEIETTLTIEEQQCLAKLIHESETSHILPS